MNNPYAESYPCATPDCDSVLNESNQKNQRKTWCNKCVRNRKLNNLKAKRALKQKEKSK